MNKTLYRPLFMAYKNVRPLALSIIKAAAGQGATLEELRIAAEVAVSVCENQRHGSTVLLAELEGEAKTALESI